MQAFKTIEVQKTNILAIEFCELIIYIYLIMSVLKENYRS